MEKGRLSETTCQLWLKEEADESPKPVWEKFRTNTGVDNNVKRQQKGCYQPCFILTCSEQSKGGWCVTYTCQYKHTLDASFWGMICSFLTLIVNPFHSYEFCLNEVQNKAWQRIILFELPLNRRFRNWRSVLTTLLRRKEGKKDLILFTWFIVIKKDTH